MKREFYVARKTL